jgi:ABC-type Mn2+/Zn2+ transport system ATPase subunit
MADHHEREGSERFRGDVRADRGRAGAILISMEGVDLGYEGAPVLKQADLEIRRGDFLGLVGPNGAGKTTLLRGIIGLLQPSRGRIRLGTAGDGMPITLGYVPQVQNLDPIYPVTVREAVSMGGFRRFGLLRRPAREEKQFLKTCLAEVGMEDHGGRLFSRLSAGQKQRVLIARALFTRPDVLLLDEPTSGADHAAERRIMDLLKRLHGEGHTLLLICHELDLVQASVKEILWIHHGRIRRESPGRLLSEKQIDEMYGA